MQKASERIIRCSYYHSDLFVIETEPITFRFLMEIYRGENERFMARVQEVNGIERFVVHLQYFEEHHKLWRNLGMIDRVVIDPLLTEEVNIWRFRTAKMEYLKSLPHDTDEISLKKEFNLSKTTKIPLRPYQEIGAAWMVYAENGLMSDSVGTGKTAQSLAYCLAMIQMGLAHKVLIACPSKLTYQWLIDGINKFVPPPFDSATLISGHYSKRHHLWHNKSYFTIANYEKLRIDQKILEQLNWDIVIFDEAGYFKSREAKLSKAISTLNRKYNFALTATAIEMNLIELFSIYEKINSGILGNYGAFKKNYCFSVNEFIVTHREDLIEENIPKQIRHTMIRRTKNQVNSQLPPVQETNIYVELEPKHRELYDRFQNEEIDESTGSIKSISTMIILEKLIRLRQICNAPEQIDFKFHKIQISKIDYLKEILINQLQGKAIVFSCFEQTIVIINRCLKLWMEEEKVPLDGLMVVSGKTKDKEREEIKEHFNHSDERLILLSTDCMRFGVNLQAAQGVVNYELPYNPASKAQRIGRAHRMGMESVNRIGCDECVLVFNLICLNTVEERIQLLLEERQELFDTVFENEQSTTNTRSNRENLEFLLTGKR